MEKGFIKKLIIVALLSGALISVFIFKDSSPLRTLASGPFNVFGWAWSSNIGWISMSSTSYGVLISDDGDPDTYKVSGYAWSSNIGWIQMDPALPTPALPNTGVRIDKATRQFSGWARTVNSTDDSYGWIRFGGPTYDVLIDDVPNAQGEYAFSGWAFGGPATTTGAIGWLSFNCLDQGVCGTSNYSTYTTFPFGPLNNPPTITSFGVNGSQVDLCGAAASSTPAGGYQVAWIFDDGADTASTYSLVLKDGTGASTLYSYAGTSNSTATAVFFDLVSANPPNFTTRQLTYDTQYQLTLTVTDTSTPPLSSAPSIITFTTPAKAPKVAFTAPRKSFVNKMVTITNTSTTTGPLSCSWDLDDGITFIDQSCGENDIVTSTYATMGTRLLTLSATDTAGVHCLVTSTIGIIKAPSQYQGEVP